MDMIHSMPSLYFISSFLLTSFLIFRFDYSLYLTHLTVSHTYRQRLTNMNGAFHRLGAIGLVGFC
uniref:Uncharacterized protein n=1 Tax=Picea glauca TaxID=3330 RepID=A0A117NIM0_PICGL|nr:hypothetical protein ABT39_MTgene3335 [Picea glauca]QHR89097.1 hypothetical protein Q903MT_gene3116 [Picea sitchensis]